MNCLITMRSETYCRRAEKILREKGIRALIIRLDSEYAKKGCGYGIKIDCRSKAAALGILSASGIPHSDVRML